MQLDKNSPIKLNQFWIAFFANKRRKTGKIKKECSKVSMGYTQLGKKYVFKTELQKVRLVLNASLVYAFLLPSGGTVQMLACHADGHFGGHLLVSRWHCSDVACRSDGRVGRHANYLSRGNAWACLLVV